MIQDIEGNSQVTLSLIEESVGITNYSVAATPNNSATATIFDDDGELEVAISSSATTTGVTERYPFDFTIRANRPVNRDLDVAILLTEAIGSNNSIQPTSARWGQ